jgi:transcriptional regulator with XRE-family HTH domain
MIIAIVFFMIDLDILEKQRTNFKKFMTEHKLNSSSWARKSGVSEATIRHYLSGRNKSITAINLEKLADAAGVSSERLLNNNAPELKQQLNSITVQKDLFIQTFSDVEAFITEAKLNLTPTMHANVLLAWYELAQIYQEQQLPSQSLSPFKNLVKTLIANGYNSKV